MALFSKLGARFHYSMDILWWRWEGMVVAQAIQRVGWCLWVLARGCRSMGWFGLLQTPICGWWVSLTCNSLHTIWKYIITHLLLVQFGPFQCCSLLFRRYPDAATWEEVCSCTTGGEQVWRSVGDGGAIFLCRWQRWLLGRQQWMGW